MNGVGDQFAGLDVRAVMNTANHAVMGVIFGTGENVLALFRHHFNQREGFEIANGGVAARVGSVSSLGHAHRMQARVEIVGPDAVDGGLGRTGVRAFIILDVGGKTGQHGQGFNREFFTQNRFANKHAFGVVVEHSAINLFRRAAGLQPVQFIQPGLGFV